MAAIIVDTEGLESQSANAIYPFRYHGDAYSARQYGTYRKSAETRLLLAAYFIPKFATPNRSSFCFCKHTEMYQ